MVQLKSNCLKMSYQPTELSDDGEPEIDWQSNQSTIQEANAYLLETETYSDVTFIVGEQRETVRAHKFILMSRSLVFEAMFQRWEKDYDCEVEVSEVSVPAFKAFLKFLYTNDFSKVALDAGQVLYLAHKYDTKVLAAICSNLMNDSISLNNALRIYKLAKSLEQSELMVKAKNFILRNARDIFTQSQLMNTEIELLYAFVPCDNLTIDELELFRALMRWADNQCRLKCIESTGENKRVVLDRLLTLIRFPIMDPRDFTSEVVHKHNGVLNDDEIIQLYVYFNSRSDVRNSLPQMPFSTQKRDLSKYEEHQTFPTLKNTSNIGQRIQTLPASTTGSTFKTVGSKGSKSSSRRGSSNWFRKMIH